MNDNARKILLKLENQCARREYCSSDVSVKCAAAGLDPAETAQVLDSLISGGFVDDARYCRAFAHEKSEFTGWGIIKIRMALAAKKLDRQIIDAALADMDREGVTEKLIRLLKTKNKALQGDPQRRLKLIRYALTRGYEYDRVSKLLPELEVDDASGEDDLSLTDETQG